jgi:hypothetical protein
MVRGTEALATDESAMLRGAPPRMLATVEALAEALFSTEAGAPPRERLKWLSRELDDFMARAGARSRLVLRASVLCIAVVAPLLIRKLGPLRSLPLAQRTEALERMESGTFALPLLAVKAILCILYYEHPDAAREIGFDGRCMLERAR